MEYVDLFAKIMCALFITYCVYSKYREKESVGWSLFWTVVFMNLVYAVFKD